MGRVCDGCGWNSIIWYFDVLILFKIFVLFFSVVGVVYGDR